MNANRPKHYNVRKGRLSENEKRLLEEYFQREWKSQGKSGDPKIGFKLDFLDGIDPKTYKKLMDAAGPEVTERTLNLVQEKIALISEGVIYELRTPVSQSRFWDIIDSFPYNLESSVMLRDQIQRSEHRLRMLQWSSKRVLDNYKNEPILAAMLINLLFHCTKSPDEWKEHRNIVEALAGTCGTLMRSENFEQAVVIEPLAMFSSLTEFQNVHQDQVKIAIQKEEYRLQDTHVINGYYGTVQKKIMAFDRHFKSRPGFQSVSDIGRLIHLISEYTNVERISTISDDDDSRSPFRTFQDDYPLLDMICLAKRMLERLKELNELPLAIEATKIIIDLLGCTERGRRLKFNLGVQQWIK